MITPARNHHTIFNQNAKIHIFASTSQEKKHTMNRAHCLSAHHLLVIVTLLEPLISRQLFPSDLFLLQSKLSSPILIPCTPYPRAPNCPYSNLLSPKP